MIKHLIPLIPPHRIYAECFGGGGRLLFAKEPSEIEVYNDIDGRLVNFFYVLREDELFERFYTKVCCTPYSREIFNRAVDILTSEEYAALSNVDQAYYFFVFARGSFSGQLDKPGWSKSFRRSRRKMADTVSEWIGAIEGLELVHNRLFRVLLENQDFRNFLPDKDSPDTFFYLDPPYVHSSRKSINSYTHEMTDKDHADLVEILLKLKGKIMLSGYANSIYEKLHTEHNWRRGKFILNAATPKENKAREEIVWLSPNCEQVIYDRECDSASREGSQS